VPPTSLSSRPDEEHDVETISVLVVDDSALMRRALKTILADAGGFEVNAARNGVDAIDQLHRIGPDVITLDVNMPEMDGLTCLNRIMEERPTPVVMISSLTEKNALVTLEALQLGAFDYVPKPGGTVSLNIDDVAVEIVDKVRAAASARSRRTGLRKRMEAAREATTGATIRTRRAVRATAARTDLVVVGSSTGGPALLSDLLSALPASFGAPIVVAQHIPASFTAALAHRLDEICALRVHEVNRVRVLETGNIYIGQGNADVVVARRPDGLIVKNVPAAEEFRWHPSVDRLTRTAARHVDPAHIIGVLLTGMGDDGAAEMKSVHDAGGRTIAESEETAVVWGMPGDLVRRGGATVVLPADQIAEHLSAWVR
jgi:two-component system, chemotaxis family, protein-glutamate methylesterase/glutaminase